MNELNDEQKTLIRDYAEWIHREIIKLLAAKTRHDVVIELSSVAMQCVICTATFSDTLIEETETETETTEQTK